MSDGPRSIPLPAEITLSLDVIRSVVAAGERALEALTASGAAGEAQALDDAIGELSAAILRAIGLMDDEG